MNLIVDIGNTAVKLAVMEGNSVIEVLVDCSSDFEQGRVFIEKHQQVKHSIIASVRSVDDATSKLINTLLPNALTLSHKTSLPIKNLYKTPETLGSDRLAAAVGAACLYPDSNVLVVDAGTAITYELVTAQGEYLGGNIAPGINMRFKALNQFTGRLPLCSCVGEYSDMGTNTQSAIEAGVLNGILYEVEGTIEHFALKFPNLKVVLTGGDTVFFENRLKQAIFVVYDIVLIGLNRILEHHAKAN